MAAPTPADDRARVLALIKRYGRTATSFQALEPNLQYWFHGQNACVAYAECGNSFVTAGGPICNHGTEIEIAHKFAAYAADRGKRLRWFATECDLSETGEFAVLHIGEQPTWRPEEWTATVANKRSLREQLRRARAKGVVVSQRSAGELSPNSKHRNEIIELAHRWLAARAMAPMGFLVHLHLLNHLQERRFFEARQDGQLIGVLAAVPIYANRGWFFEDVLRDPRAPNGTIELLFDAAMRSLARDGANSVTYGLAPLANVKSPWLRRIRDRSRRLYDFDGLHRFKTKLVPSSWQPIYLAFPATERGVRATVDSLKAFAHGSFLRFAWRTLLHRARTVTRWLAALLVPWTIAIGLADAHWFPAPWVQWAWVGLDCALFAALLVHARHWTRTGAVALSLAASVDFALGCVQLATHNVGNASGIDWFIIVLAQAAPLFAAVFLWSARRGINYRPWLMQSG